MRIFRFDPVMSYPITQHGSRFKLGPLVADGARVRIVVMHLPADGLIGRHPAGLRQALAVVVGSGWVSGGDGRERIIRAGYAALWEPGEEHETRTEDGLTAVCIEGDFEMAATSVTRDIVVEDYNPEWPSWFQQVHDVVGPVVAEVAVRIDHVGSTSVPGLAAKPIIDMDIVVADPSGIEPVKERLARIGYRWHGDCGVEGREAFEPPPDSALPRHNLYLVVEDNKAHLDHWLLRDLLRADPEARRRYGDLKRANVAKADSDIDVYVAAKASLVAELLSRARRERGLPPATYWDPESESEGI